MQAGHERLELSRRLDPLGYAGDVDRLIEAVMNVSLLEGSPR